jgi:hypothetical protein
VCDVSSFPPSCQHWIDLPFLPFYPTPFFAHSFFSSLFPFYIQCIHSFLSIPHFILSHSMSFHLFSVPYSSQSTLTSPLLPFASIHISITLHLPPHHISISPLLPSHQLITSYTLSASVMIPLHIFKCIHLFFSFLSPPCALLPLSIFFSVLVFQFYFSYLTLRFSPDSVNRVNRECYPLITRI